MSLYYIPMVQQISRNFFLSIISSKCCCKNKEVSKQRTVLRAQGGWITSPISPRASNFHDDDWRLTWKSARKQSVAPWAYTWTRLSVSHAPIFLYDRRLVWRTFYTNQPASRCRLLMPPLQHPRTDDRCKNSRECEWFFLSRPPRIDPVTVGLWSPFFGTHLEKLGAKFR